VAGILLL